MTVEEFDAFVLLPEDVDREFEFIGGEIYEVVSNPLSSNTGARISGFLFVYLSQNDISHLTGADGGYMVSGERYIPDAAFISYVKQPELSSTDGYNPPDLAVEVLSPSNDDEKMRIKIANYLAAGTRVWVFDPEEQGVEVYIPGQPVKILGLNDVLDGGDVLPGFKLPVKNVFPPKREE